MKLREFLEILKHESDFNQKKGQVYFAKKIGISHRTLMNVLNQKNIQLETALLIQKGTAGLVRCEELLDVDNYKANKKKNKQQQQNQGSLDTGILTNNPG